MIFDKNFLKSHNDNAYDVYKEESGSADFVNPYNDSPYLISSLQKLRSKVVCKKKKKVIEECLSDYSNDIVENPELNPFTDPDQPPQPESFADYAKLSYQKVIKDLQNIQKLIDKLDGNEPDSLRIIP